MSILWISVFTYFVAFTSACEQPPGWVSQSIETRADEASIVIIGKVQDTTDGGGGAPCRSDTECGFWANIIVDCVLKDDVGGITVGSVLKVTGFGLNSDCTETDIIRNSNQYKYILLLSVREDIDNLYAVDEVNRQTAAERITDQEMETYVNHFPNSECGETTLAPTTTMPTTQRGPTTRRSTTPKVSTSGMKVTSTKVNKKTSPEREARIDATPTTTSSSSKITIEFLTLIFFTLITLLI